MKPDERIDLAKEKIERILNALTTLEMLRANNEALRSSALTAQVDKSYAANTFNVLSYALFEAEVVRVCAVWDSVSNNQKAKDRDSLPAVVRLLDDAGTVEILAQQREADGKLRVPIIVDVPGTRLTRDEQEQMASEFQLKRAADEAKKLKERWEEAKKLISAVLLSAEYLELKNHRDKHVAHALVETRYEKDGKVTGPAKYGHETKLYDQAVQAFDLLYFILKDASYSWVTMRENAERCATALWSKCEFNIVE